jgi:hypothetical protein
MNTRSKCLVLSLRPPATFKVMNAGSKRDAQDQGNGIQKKLKSDLEPGAWWHDAGGLKPGTCEASCPISATSIKA